MSTRSKKYAPSPRQRFRENTTAFTTSLKLSFRENVVLFKTKLSYNRFSNRLLMSQHVVSKLSLYLPESAFVFVRHTRQAATHQGTTLVRRSILLKFASREEDRLYSFSNLRFGRDLKLSFELLNSFGAKATTLDFGIAGNTEWMNEWRLVLLTKLNACPRAVRGKIWRNKHLLCHSVGGVAKSTALYGLEKYIVTEQAKTNFKIVKIYSGLDYTVFDPLLFFFCL